MAVTPIAFDFFPQARVPETDRTVGRASEAIFCTVIVTDDIDGTGMFSEPAS